MLADEDIVFLHGFHTPRCAAKVNKTFDYFTLQLMTRGAVELFYGANRHEMHGPWLWPCHPGPHIRFHGWPIGRDWEHRYIAFSGPAALRWRKSGLLLDTPERVADDELTLLVQRFDDLMHNAARPDPLGRRIARNQLEQILLLRADRRQRTTAPAAEPWLAEAIRKMTSHGFAPDYDAMALSAAMSLSTFRRRFKQATGLSVHRFAMRQRLRIAKDLLAQRDVSIKEIAAQTGYRDVYYFSRHFRQVFSVSPGKYRKSVQM